MTNRRFSERLNQSLDDIGMPAHLSERIDAFAKWIDRPRYKAEAILNGQVLPEKELLTLLATELEVSEAWLLGQSDA